MSHVLKCLILFVNKLNVNSHQFYFTVMFTYKTNMAKHTKEMPAGTVFVTRTAPCEGHRTCVSSSSLFSFMLVKEKKNNSTFISLLKADFGRQKT